LQTTPTQTPAADARAWLRHARVLATLLLLAALAALGVRHAGDLHRLLEARPQDVAAMALCVLGIRLLHGEIVRRTLAEIGHRLPGFEVFALSVLAAVPNFFVPRSGFGTLALALRARHGVPLAVSSSLVLPLAALDFIFIAATGLAVQIGVVGLDHPHAPVIALIFGVVLLAGCAGLLVRVPLRLPFGPPRVRAFFERFDAAWAELRGSRRFLVRASVLLAGICALRIVRLALAFAALGYAPDLAGLVVASLLGDLMFLLALTPGGLGLREAAIVYCADLAGVTPDASLAAALLDRLVMMGSILVIAQLSAWRLFGARGRRA
jgi:Mg2+-importing ATPase